MTGKEKCEILRSIRREIAKTNNIPLPAWMEEECTYQGDDCKGTCPKCESEIRYLEDMLNVMVAAGMKLRLSGISADAIPSEAARRNSIFDGFHVPELPAGVMRPMDPPKKVWDPGEDQELMGDMQPPDDWLTPEVGVMVRDDEWDDDSSDF